MLLWWFGGCVLNLTGATVIEQPIDRLEIDVRHADVEVRPVEEGLPTVGFEFVGLGEAEVRVDVIERVLHLQDPCGGSDLCAGTLRLELPADVDIQADIEDGNLRMMSMRGEVMADVGGRITLQRHTGRLVDVASRAGTGMELEFDAVPDQVSALLTNGLLDATVPAGSYALDLEASEMVAVEDGIVSDPKSPFELMMTARAGSIRLQAR